MNNHNIKIKNNRGFTLIEALIGFFILSIGMLGIASLQTLSLKAGKTSVYASVAMIKVDGLIESMRANPTALATYAGAGAFQGCWDTAVCDETQLANDDVYLWKKNLTAGLPSNVSTTVIITAPVFASSKMSTVAVTVSWKERGKSSNTSVTKSYATAATICTANPC